jgi:hypothetical protein
MSLEDKLSDFRSAGVVDWTNDAEVPPAVADLLEALVEEVQSLKGATRPRPAENTNVEGGITRIDALTAARVHVEAMSTNGRGFQDGVKLSDKVQAVDRFARFLMGESE